MCCLKFDYISLAQTLVQQNTRWKDLMMEEISSDKVPFGHICNLSILPSLSDITVHTPYSLIYMVRRKTTNFYLHLPS